MKFRLLRVPEAGYVVLGPLTYDEVGKIYEPRLEDVDPEEVTNLAEGEEPYIEVLAGGSSSSEAEA